MDNLIIDFDGIGEASLHVVDDETYDILFNLYENQKAGHDGYDEMIEEFWRIYNKADEKKNFQRLVLQWNSHDHLEKPIKFKRMLQVLSC